MRDPAAMAEAQEQALGIFADAVLQLALDIQKDALACGDLDQKVSAAGAVHQLGRGLRQTIALQSRLAREARADAAAAPPRPKPPSLRRPSRPIPGPSPCAVAATG